MYKYIEDFNGLKLIEYKIYSDNRGHFEELYKASKYHKLPEMSQWNHSFSKKGVFRGMHFQWNPFMGKLVTCLSGSIYDAVIDIRKDSPTYGDHCLVSLCEEDGTSLWVPPGFAHGFFATEDSNVIYGCSGEYNGHCEAGISYKIISETLLSSIDVLFHCDYACDDFLMTDKDRNAQSLEEWEKNPDSNVFTYEEV